MNYTKNTLLDEHDLVDKKQDEGLHIICTWSNMRENIDPS